MYFVEPHFDSNSYSRLAKQVNLSVAKSLPKKRSFHKMIVKLHRFFLDDSLL